MKKLLLTLVVLSALSVTACSKVMAPGDENLPDEVQQKNEVSEQLKRDQTRIANLHNLTYSLAKYQQLHGDYPKANDTWCAKDMIELLKTEVQANDVVDPAVQKVEGLECEKVGIYYFFRENNPDYYTFGIKLENDYMGNSYLSPQELAKLPVEDLLQIRLTPEGIRGNYYYIIGNFPIELLPEETN